MKTLIVFAYLFIAFLFIGCSHSRNSVPEGMTITSGSGSTTGTTETGTAAPTGITGASTTTRVGQVIPKEGAGSNANPIVSKKEDARITESVRQAIQQAGIAVDRLDVSTENGIVTLQGTASDRVTADTAVSIARSVNGVKDVRSALQISG